MSAVQATANLRPARLLPMGQLVLISVYWFGINAVWGAYEGFGQEQLELIVGKANVGTVMGTIELIVAIIPILTVPIVGALSDYTSTRWGKRKAYIITGTTFDLIFITGLSLIAMSQPPGWDGEALGSTGLLVVYTLLFLGLQFSSNVAQGPYQGLVPDLVAEPQVGMASSFIGPMRVVGFIGGTAAMALGGAFELWGLAFFTVGLIEFILAVATFMGVDDGPPAKPREGRSWLTIALETWDLGILKERSFIRMTLVRLFFLMGASVFINITLIYVERVFGLTEGTERSVLWAAALGLGLLGTVLAAIPAARLSDRIGRKPVVWIAAVIASFAVIILAVAPTPPIAVAGAFFLGAGYGAYLAVDWALMTDIIPLASSGRFMGIANIANSIAGPLAVVIAGPILDAYYRAGDEAMGARVAVGLGVIGFALASVILIGVHPRRDPRDPELNDPDAARA